ncbi:hypothetical protein YC2023_006528 [Brassica napus]
MSMLGTKSYIGPDHCGSMGKTTTSDDDAEKTLVFGIISPGGGGYRRSVAAGLLSPWRGRSFRSAVIGSSLRGVKASSALRRQLSSGGKNEDACDSSGGSRRIMMMEELSLRRLSLSGLSGPKLVESKEEQSDGAPVWPCDPVVGSPASTSRDGMALSL